MAERWPRCSRGAAGVQPRCSRGGRRRGAGEPTHRHQRGALAAGRAAGAAGGAGGAAAPSGGASRLGGGGATRGALPPRRAERCREEGGRCQDETCPCWTRSPPLPSPAYTLPAPPQPTYRFRTSPHTRPRPCGRSRARARAPLARDRPLAKVSLPDRPLLALLRCCSRAKRSTSSARRRCGRRFGSSAPRWRAARGVGATGARAGVPERDRVAIGEHGGVGAAAVGRADGRDRRRGGAAGGRRAGRRVDHMWAIVWVEGRAGRPTEGRGAVRRCAAAMHGRLVGRRPKHEGRRGNVPRSCLGKRETVCMAHTRHARATQFTQLHFQLIPALNRGLVRYSRCVVW